MAIKHDKQHDEAIKKAVEDFWRPDGKEMVEKCPYLFSSDRADAYWITAYFLYHCGKEQRALRRSRGHSWRADVPGMGEVVVKVHKPDHREGVEICSS